MHDVTYRRLRGRQSEWREGQDAPAYHALDTYHDVPIEIEEARLDNFAIALQEVSDSKGYIIAYAGRHARADEAQTRAKRAKNYLVNKRDIKTERIVIIDGGYREDFTLTELPNSWTCVARMALEFLKSEAV